MKVWFWLAVCWLVSTPFLYRVLQETDLNLEIWHALFIVPAILVFICLVCVIHDIVIHAIPSHLKYVRRTNFRTKQNAQNTEDQLVIKGRLQMLHDQSNNDPFGATILDLEAPLVYGRYADNTHYLKDGDYLKIYNEDNTIRWEGELEFIRPRSYDRGFFPNHRLSNIKRGKKPLGISFRNWVRWFSLSPQPQAELRRKK